MSGWIDLAVGRWFSEFGEEGIFTTDESLNITSWNHWLERHTGRSASELIGQPLLQVIPDLKERGIDEHYRDALTGKTHLLSHLLHGYLLPLRVRSGSAQSSIMPQRVRIAPLIVSTEVVGTLTIIDDVTERVAAEVELRKQIAAQQAARARAEEAVRMKDQFLAMLAHELRNPLAPIRNAVHYMQMKRSLEPDIQNAREIIERQLQHMTRLVDDLLDLSRVTRGIIDIRKEPVSLKAIVQNAVETSRPLIESRRHELDIRLPEEDVYLEADFVRVSQVLLNMLNNAAKYTPPGGRIALSAWASDRDVVVSVKDSGIGISPESLEYIFETFVQLGPGPSGGAGGLGIGLSLARQLMELHGGNIKAYSGGVGQGSEFVASLPRGTPGSVPALQPASAAEASVARHTSRGRRVLVVDDNVDAADSLALNLQIEGHVSRATYSGPEAIEEVARFLPEVVLLDIGMPAMDGYEVARRIRAQPGGKQLLLIALTGWGQEGDKGLAREAGFDYHLVKPVDPQVLQQKISANSPRTANPS